MCIKKMEEFCKKLKGDTQVYPTLKSNYFNCIVSPKKVLERWEEFENTLKEINGLEFAIFGNYYTDIIYIVEKKKVTFNIYKEVPMEKVDDVWTAMSEVFGSYLLHLMQNQRVSINTIKVYYFKVRSIVAEHVAKIFGVKTTYPEKDILQLTVVFPLDELSKRKDVFNSMFVFSKAIFVPVNTWLVPRVVPIDGEFQILYK